MGAERKSTLMRAGVFTAVAIAIHNIPEGISVSVPIFYATHLLVALIRKYPTIIDLIANIFHTIVDIRGDSSPVTHMMMTNGRNLIGIEHVDTSSNRNLYSNPNKNYPERRRRMEEVSIALRIFIGFVTIMIVLRGMGGHLWGGQRGGLHGRLQFHPVRAGLRPEDDPLIPHPRWQTIPERLSRTPSVDVRGLWCRGLSVEV